MEVARHLQAEQAAAAEQKAHEANQCLANIQASHSCDVDLPTPRPDVVPPPLSSRQCTSQANVATLLAEGHTGGGGGGAGNTHNVGHDADKGADAGEHQEGYSDGDNMDESPVKRPRTVLIPDPVTPLPTVTQKMTAAQKKQAELELMAAKAAERLVKEKAKMLKAAENVVKAAQILVKYARKGKGEGRGKGGESGS